MEYLLFGLLFVLFAWVHTLFAQINTKSRIIKRWPIIQPWYRMIYSLGSVAFLSTWYLYLPKSSPILYQFDGANYWILKSGQFISGIGLIHSLIISYPFIFSGIYQVLKRKEVQFELDEPQNGSKLRINSIYAYVRHPMYFWTISYLALNPIVSTRSVFLLILFGLYFYVGSFPEEKKLLLKFGETYKKYQKNVPRLLPIPWKKYRV